MTKQGAVPTLHNEVRKERSTKDNWIEERCDSMAKGIKVGNSKEAYELSHQNQLAESSCHR